MICNGSGTASHPEQAESNEGFVYNWKEWGYNLPVPKDKTLTETV